MIYAHSLPDQSSECWEPLAEHLMAVGNRAATLAKSFGWAEVARISGLLHDIGKCSPDFQAYIRSDGQGSGGDHSTAGARVAFQTYGPVVGRMLAFIIAGHHAGLSDAADLERRLSVEHGIPSYADWEAHSGPLPLLTAVRSTRPIKPSFSKGFEAAFLIRMLFSSLVDADSLETERFYSEAKGEPIDRGSFTELASLRDRLRGHMAELRARAAQEKPTQLNALRAEVLDNAIAKAELPPGLFTLTVPTGGGKTLASLSFALEHAVRHGLRRIVYVIPFTSIIEQTAEVFRIALRAPEDILEHHASFDWEGIAGDLRRIDDEGGDALRKLRHAAENWDASIVVTTAVQFFESLFANKRSRCRKLHNLVGSVVVLDEVQTLPVKLLRPCLAGIDELARNYGSSLVLCTATQPAVRKQDAAIFGKLKEPLGLDIPKERELAPDPTRLYTALKRVEVERLSDKIADEAVVARFIDQPQMLCIVNSRKHASALFEAMRVRKLAGAVHLTTLMCPLHRRIVLAELRRKLKCGEPVRLVATSLIEAGVDIDFPEVWRATTGLDSIAQAAGRCNREGGPVLGRVIVFEPADEKAPRDLNAFRQAAEAVFRKHSDPLTLDAVKAYFGEVYWTKGADALDAANVGGYAGILAAISERAPNLDFPFASIAEAFRMIEDVMEPVVVPWRADDGDRDAETLLARIAASERPRRDDMRRLQQYVVGIPRKARAEWLAMGALRAVHPGLGDAVLKFESLALYDPDTGVRLDGTFSDYIL